MIQLAATYRTSASFRTVVLTPTPRGRELGERYDENHAELQRLAARHLRLVDQVASAWLAVHPYLAAIVELAQEGSESEGERLTLSPEQFHACKAVLRELREASSDATFTEVVRELERELDTYEGLTAAAALEQLRAAPARAG